MFDRKKQKFNKKTATENPNSKSMELSDEALLFAIGGTGSEVGTCSSCGTSQVNLIDGFCAKCATQIDSVQ